MDKIKLLNEIKNEMMSILSKMDSSTLTGDFEKLSAYLSILKGLKELPAESPKGGKLELADPESGREIKDEVNHLYIGRFKRELTGGTIGSFRIFVPESVVRNLRLQEGDWVRAKGLKSVVMKNGNLRTLYDYSVAKRIKEPLLTPRRELSYVRVQYDESALLYYIDVTERLENYGRLVISERDMHNLDVSEGDLVDYAYFEDEPTTGKVVWRHKLNVPIQEPVESSELPAFAEASAHFRDRSYVVVGTMKEALVAQEAIEDFGGQLGFLSGDEHSDVMERVATDADEIIIIVDSIAPAGLRKIREIGGQNRLPMRYLQDCNTNTMLMTLLKKEAIIQEADAISDEETA